MSNGIELLFGQSGQPLLWCNMYPLQSVRPPFPVGIAMSHRNRHNKGGPLGDPDVSGRNPETEESSSGDLVRAPPRPSPPGRPGRALQSKFRVIGGGRLAAPLGRAPGALGPGRRQTPASLGARLRRHAGRSVFIWAGHGPAPLLGSAGIRSFQRGAGPPSAPSSWSRFRGSEGVRRRPPWPRGLPWGHRTLARAWRGHGAGVARAIGIFWLGAVEAWRGHVLFPLICLALHSGR
eukprot:gene25832-biopygen21024